MSLDPEDAHAIRPAGRLSIGPLPPGESPIVPRSTIAGRALVAVIAIMTFLAALTTGAVMLVRAAASDWQSEVAREVTIQVRPAANRDIEADITKASEIARSSPGVAQVRAYTKDESARLLEPWLGTGLALDELPVPRVIVVRVAPGVAPDLATLRQQITAEVPTASLDDHRSWVERMRTMARTAVIGGVLVLILVFAGTVLSVTFATRGAVATNRPIVEVLHFIGAKDGFIASHFQRHFLVLGLKGGAIGGGSAILVFALAELVSQWSQGTAGADQMSALFGSFSIGPIGYAAVFAQVVLIAVVTATTTRYTVNRTIDSIQ